MSRSSEYIKNLIGLGISRHSRVGSVGVHASVKDAGRTDNRPE
jgi:hypothetical protein